jgi:hypothetical protein
MLIELFQRLFGATRDAIAHPYFDAGSRAVELSSHAALFGQKIGSLLVGSGAVPVWSRL